MSKKKKTTYCGYCHFHRHPGEMTLGQIRQKRCGQKGCQWFEEYVDLSPRKQQQPKSAWMRLREEYGQVM